MKRYLFSRIVTVILTVLLFLYFKPAPTIPESNPEPVEEVEESTTLLDSIRAELIKETAEYIHRKFPNSKLSAEVLVAKCEEYGFDICFAIAQAEIESHLGTAGLASKTNSVWNIGAYDGRSHHTMNELGLSYEHPDESIEPYIITVRERYLGTDRTIQDLMKQYVDRYGRRYASNPNYEDSLARKYRYIWSSTSIGALQEMLLSLRNG